MDDIKSTISITTEDMKEHRKLGAEAERMRIKWAIGTNADTILEYNERIKGIADELIGDQHHTLLHISEMIEICGLAIIDITKEVTNEEH
jgi:hypothetical protein